jgi:hypothetical protein
LSVTANGNLAACAGACLYNFLVGNGTTISVPTAATGGINETGGTSAIIVDNTSSGTGESQIYFGSLGAETCGGNTATPALGAGTGGSCAAQTSQTAP